MAVQINSGYIVNQGLDVIFGLINNSQTLMNLDVFRFGIGKKANHIVNIVDLTDRTFTYSTGIFTLASGTNLPSTLSISSYPYIWINNLPYSVINYDLTLNQITINTSYRNYTGVTSDIVITGAIASIPNQYQVFSNQFLTRTAPQFSDVVPLGGVTGSISKMTSIDENTIEIQCVIPQNPDLAEAIYFDEVYLYGNNNGSILDIDMKLIFVSEMTYGSGVYTGLESNIFNIQIALSNVFQTNEINYNINNLSLKQDIDVIQLILLYIMSVKQHDIRILNNKLVAMDSTLNPFKDPDFVTVLFDKVKDYILSKLDTKYQKSTETLVTTNIDLINSVELENINLDSLPWQVRTDIKRVIGIVPKELKQNTTVYIGGYPQNTLFYVSNGVIFNTITNNSENKILAYNLDSTDLVIANRFIPLKVSYSTIVINDTDDININILDELISGYETSNI